MNQVEATPVRGPLISVSVAYTNFKSYPRWQPFYRLEFHIREI